MNIKGIHFATGEPISVTIEGKRIKQITSEKNNSPFYIAPGLVDLQINGYKGYDFNTLPIPKDLVRHITEAVWKEGITSYYPTVITNSDEAIEEAVATIAMICDNDHLDRKSTRLNSSHVK